jgi:hypothetical protein
MSSALGDTFSQTFSDEGIPTVDDYRNPYKILGDLTCSEYNRAYNPFYKNAPKLSRGIYQELITLMKDVDDQYKNGGLDITMFPIIEEIYGEADSVLKDAGVFYAECMKKVVDMPLLITHKKDALDASKRFRATPGIIPLLKYDYMLFVIMTRLISLLCTFKYNYELIFDVDFYENKKVVHFMKNCEVWEKLQSKPFYKYE